MKLLKHYLITILLMTAICSPVFAQGPRRQAEIAKTEIKKTVAAIGQSSKEAGRTIGQYFKEIGKQTEKVLKDMARTFRDTVEKD